MGLLSILIAVSVATFSHMESNYSLADGSAIIAFCFVHQTIVGADMQMLFFSRIYAVYPHE